METPSDEPEYYVEWTEAEIAATEAALAELDAGFWVHSHASVVAWMESLGTPHELPVPEPDVYIPPRRSGPS
jgi:predicted transcriptional regulator